MNWMPHLVRCLTVTLLLLCPALATASEYCFHRDVIVERLSTQYAEKPVSRGLQGDAQLFEVFMSKDGQSWTLVQSFPTGMSCVMAAGTDWLMDDLSKVFAIEG